MSQIEIGASGAGSGGESAEGVGTEGYRLEGFSVERLMRFATALGQDVVIELRPRVGKKGPARVMVVGAA